MPIDPSRYVLPPPVGQSNDLYEAYPAKPGSDGFSLPGATISNAPLISGGGDGKISVPVTTQSITNPDAVNDSGLSSPMSSVAGSSAPVNDSALGAAAPSVFTDPVGALSSAITGTFSGLTGNAGLTVSAPSNSIQKAIDNAVKNTVGFTSDIFARGSIVILGIAFVLGGLILLAMERGTIPSPATLFKK